MNLIGLYYNCIGLGIGRRNVLRCAIKKINTRTQPKKFWNVVAFICACIAIAIHGMIGFDIKTVIEAMTTFVLMYGSILVYDKTDNAWGNILIFFLIWNAL